jgi:hypothetical protein
MTKFYVETKKDGHVVTYCVCLDTNEAEAAAKRLIDSGEAAAITTMYYHGMVVCRYWDHECRAWVQGARDSTAAQSRL